MKWAHFYLRRQDCKPAWKTTQQRMTLAERNNSFYLLDLNFFRESLQYIIVHYFFLVTKTLRMIKKKIQSHKSKTKAIKKKNKIKKSEQLNSKKAAFLELQIERQYQMIRWFFLTKIKFNVPLVFPGEWFVDPTYIQYVFQIFP